MELKGANSHEHGRLLAIINVVLLSNFNFFAILENLQNFFCYVFKSGMQSGSLAHTMKSLDMNKVASPWN